MYSASVVDHAVMVCILEAQVIGAPANRTIQPKMRFGCHWVDMGILLTPVSCKVSVHPTIKVPLLVGTDYQAHVS